MTRAIWNFSMVIMANNACARMHAVLRLQVIHAGVCRDMNWQGVGFIMHATLYGGLVIMMCSYCRLEQAEYEKYFLLQCRLI